MKIYMTKRFTKITLLFNELHLSCVLSLGCIIYLPKLVRGNQYQQRKYLQAAIELVLEIFQSHTSALKLIGKALDHLQHRNQALYIWEDRYCLCMTFLPSQLQLRLLSLVLMGTIQNPHQILLQAKVHFQMI